MAVAKITGQGMSTIAALVVLLWTCILAEHRTVRTASHERYLALTALRAMQVKRGVHPARKPLIRRHPGRLRTNLG